MDVAGKMIDAHCEQVKDAMNSVKAPLVLALTWAMIWLWSIYSNEFSLNDGLGRRTMYGATLVEYVLSSSADGTSDDEKTLANIEKQRPYAVKMCKNHIFGKYQGGFEEISWLSRKSDGEIDAKGLLSGDRVLTEKYLQSCLSIMKRRLDNVERRLSEVRHITIPGGFGTVSASDFGVVGGLSLTLIVIWLHMMLRRLCYSVGAFFDLKSLNLSSPEGLTLAPAFPCYSSRLMGYAYQAVSQRFFLVSATQDVRVVIGAAVLLLFPLLPVIFNSLLSLYGLSSPIWESRVYYTVVWEFGILVMLSALTVMNVLMVRRTQLILAGWYLAATKVWLRADTPEHGAAPRVLVNLLGRSVGKDIRAGDQTDISSA